MPEPTRPEPDDPFVDRLRTAIQGWRAPPATGAISLVVVGLVLLGFGGVWAWSTWQSRSSPPIDDLLPLLIATEPVGAQGADSDGSAAAPADGSTNEAGGDRLDEAAREDPLVGQEAQQAQPTPTPDAASVDPTPLIVHVSGSVVRPGVVQVRSGGRVFEAVAAAGGTSESADLDRVNLAAPLVDGERIHIPARGEQDLPELIPSDRPSPGVALDGVHDDSTSGVQGGAGAPSLDRATEPVLVDLNRATITELEQLPGVGPTIARAISVLREARGPYDAVDELLLVDGIGPAKLEALRPFAWVEDR